MPLVATGRARVVGRRAELARLQGVLDGLPGAEAQLVHVVGEPGIGKTRLVAELLDGARARGFRALSGRASEFDQDARCAVWIDALAEHVTAAARGGLDGLAIEHRRALGAVFPVLAETDEVAPSPPSMDHLLPRSFSALLEQLARERPVVLALDDLQWADAASIEAVLHVVERPPGAPVLLALAYRPRQLPRGLARALEDVGGRSGTRIELAPLSRRDAGELMPAELPAEARRHLYEDSGGNPFYLEQLVRDAESAEPGERRAAQGAGEARVPSAVMAATARELASLPEAARLVLEAAAVAGDPFEPEVAAAGAGIAGEAAPASIDELVERDLVRPTGTLGRFRFRHPILHRAVYEQSRPAWQIGSHARVAAALAARGAPPTVRAHHVERYAQPGDMDSIALLEQAAQAAATRAPATAAHWYRAARELLPHGPQHAERQHRLLLGHAIALGLAGELVESSALFHRLLDELPEGAATLRTQAVRHGAIIEHLLGNHEQAQRLALTRLAEIGDGASEAIELRVDLAYAAFFAADWDAIRRWARDALDGEAPGAPLRAAAHALLAVAELGSGRVREAEREARRASEVVDGLPDPQLAARVEATAMLAWAEYCLGALDDSLAHSGRGIRVCQAFEQRHLIAAPQLVHAMALLVKGAPGRAAELARDAIESSRLSGNRLFLTWALTVRCDAELQAGDARRAVELGERAQAAAAGSRSPWSSVALPLLAEARLEAGQPQRCLDTLLDSDGEPRLPPFPYYAPRCHELLARAELRLGTPGRRGGEGRGCPADGRPGRPARPAGDRQPRRGRARARGRRTRAGAAGRADRPRARRRGRPVARGGALPAAGRQGARGRRRRRGGRRASPRPHRARGARRHPLPRPRGRRAAQARTRRRPRPRRRVRRRCDAAQRARARGRRARRRGAHQPRDRRAAGAEREDRREPPVAHLSPS